MIKYANEETIAYIKQHFSNTPTNSVAETVNLTINLVRSLAKKYQVEKCPLYKETLKQQLFKDWHNWFERSIAAFKPSYYQKYNLLLLRSLNQQLRLMESWLSWMHSFLQKRRQFAKYPSLHFFSKYQRLLLILLPIRLLFLIQIAKF